MIIFTVTNNTMFLERPAATKDQEQWQMFLWLNQDPLHSFKILSECLYRATFPKHGWWQLWQGCPGRLFPVTSTKHLWLILGTNFTGLRSSKCYFWVYLWVFPEKNGMWLLKRVTWAPCSRVEVQKEEERLSWSNWSGIFSPAVAPANEAPGSLTFALQTGTGSPLCLLGFHS